MTSQAPLAQLGEFIIKFQLVEAALSQLIEDIVQPDPEYARALTAELEFTAKTRALDVIFTRFARIHGLSQESPHPEFHRLMARVARLAARRNDLVHSFYGVIVTTDERIGLLRTPTKLKPSKGLLREDEEALLHEHLEQDVEQAHALLKELWEFRDTVISLRHGSQ